MVKLTALVATVLAVAVATAVDAHPGVATAHAHDLSDAKLIAERRSFKQTAHKSLAACSNSASMRQLHERSESHRKSKWEELRKEKLHEAASVLSKNHKSTKLKGITSPKDVDPTALFGTKPAACVLEPDVTEGPFYVKGELVRNDIRENQAGIDLYTELQIIDVNTCEPVAGLYLDFWQCNSTGVYSGVVSEINGDARDLENINATHSRGLAPTNHDGIVQFISKFPGHYTMRTTHIHVLGNHGGQLLANNTFVGSSVSNVGQIFFDQDLIAQVEATGIYKTNQQPMTTNAEDGIFLDEASTEFDPIVEYVLLGDTVEDGIFAWISIGVDLKHTASVYAAASLTANGGVSNPDPFDFFPQQEAVQMNAVSNGTNSTNTGSGRAVVVDKEHNSQPSTHPVLALILVALVLCVSNALVGGGLASAVATTGILVAIFTLVHGVDLNQAIALAIVTTTGTGLATFVATVRLAARQPVTNQSTLIDWDLLLVVQPTLLLGVLIGVFMRGVLPSWLLSTVVATLLLICGSLLLQASHRRPDEPIGWSINEGSSLLDKPPASMATMAGAPPLSDAIQKVPMEKLGVLVGVVFGVVVLQWALAVSVPVVMLLYLAYKSYKTTMDTFERQQLPRVSPGQGEIKWTLHIVNTIPLISSAGGLVTGLLGLGSDLVVIPFTLQAGLGNTAATATGPTIALFSGLLAALEGMVQGGVNGTLWLFVLVLAFAVKNWGDEAMVRVLPAYLRGETFLLFVFAIMTLGGGIALAIAVA